MAPPTERAAGWLWHPSDESPSERLQHPAVVLREIAGAFLVIHGTSTPRDREGRRVDAEALPAAPDATVFWVDAESDEGRALKLTKRTYFHRKAVDLIRRAEDFDSLATCPAALFLELRRIAGFSK